MPLLDSVNHDFKANVNFGFVHKGLHLKKTKSYWNKYNFEKQTYENENEIARLNLLPIFTGEGDPEVLKEISGQPAKQEDIPDCFGRF